MTKLRNTVGERIRAIRKTKGLTQQQLAELSGLDDAYIGSVERGERNFSIDTLEKIVTALQIPAIELFFDLNNMNELQLFQQKAIDEYTDTVRKMNIKQITILNKLVKNMQEAFE
ncbi:helix-turn-helix transcriptional regulator [Paenibacillus amylolyticus]|uniref:Helix-turn-helix transcriptional regulator n=1 Tax=Paenibacillus amylolyticus TaxID=1451 RepID=A0ABD8ASJ0_PAEAM